VPYSESPFPLRVSHHASSLKRRRPATAIRRGIEHDSGDVES
jgi:hypothetical protein